MSDSLKTVRTRAFNLPATPQTEKAAKGQKKNHAGGFTFTVTDLDRAKRFLILGSESSFYQSGQKLSKENAKVLIKLAESDSKTLVDLIVEVSLEGRAPKQDPGLFALAIASSFGTTEAKQYALSKLNAVARTGTSLFLFLTYALQFRGWGRGLKNAVAKWYTDKDIDKLAYQTVKYRNREGFTHKAAMKRSHPSLPNDEDFNGLAKWIRDGDTTRIPRIVEGFIKAKGATEKDLIVLIKEYDLTWEMVPNDKLTKKVWTAILVSGNLPLGALIRQLPTLTRLDVLKPLSAELSLVTDRLVDPEEIKRARIHPIDVLIAMKTYALGRSEKGKGVWTPNQKVVDALNDAFYLSFVNVEATGQRFLLALDVSQSMTNQSFPGLSAREITAAISLVISQTEKNTHTIGFTASNQNAYRPAGSHARYNAAAVTELNISAKQRLDGVMKEISNLPYGATDCALPMLYAMEKNLKVDTFVIMSDNETYSGTIHPFEALKQYRAKTGIPAKLIVLTTTATKFSIADPKDAGMLDIGAFDSAVPKLIAEFSKGL